MQNIINPHNIIKGLAKNGLQIGDKSILNYHIKNFNFNTFIYGYSTPFYSDIEKRRYDLDANSDELINFYKFDRDMANHVLRYILVIEKIVNTSVAYGIINYFHIKDKCLFKLDQDYIEHKIFINLKNVEPKITYIFFVRKLIKYLSSSTITKHYCLPNIHNEVFRWRNCPLDIMCLTWSFATSFSLFIALPIEAQANLLGNFELGSEHYIGFVEFLKNTLHLRNFISHNNVIYDIKIVYQSPSLIKLYESIFKKNINEIRLFQMMELIEHFAHSTTLISNTRYYLNKLKIQQKFKGKIQLYKDMNDGKTTI